MKVKFPSNKPFGKAPSYPISFTAHTLLTLEVFKVSGNVCLSSAAVNIIANALVRP
jgi:hypothetical protein